MQEAEQESFILHHRWFTDSFLGKAGYGVLDQSLTDTNLPQHPKKWWAG